MREDTLGKSNVDLHIFMLDGRSLCVSFRVRE